MSVRLTVSLDCGHKLEYVDRIEEKYPFWCPDCEDYCGRDTSSYKWPWTIETEITDDQPA